MQAHGAPFLFRRLTDSAPIFCPTTHYTGCAPDGAGHTLETGCHYGVACLLNCGSAQGAFTAPILFCQ